jgi:general L-amino acid transport system permease protein
MDKTKVPRRPRFWRSSRKLRAVIWQALVVAVLIALGLWFVSNTLTNLELRRINSGFGFLQGPAAIPIGETLIAYVPGDTNLRAIAVGLCNTLLVSVLGIVLATVIGVAVGVSRLSRNWLLARLASIYVEYIRNVPLLAHLMVIYVVLQGLPPLRSALSLGGFAFLSNRGLVIPTLALGGDWWPVVTIALPRLDGLNFVGGHTLSPELTALLVGLALYSSAFIAEIVRGGILAVPPGQWEAGYALGLERRRVLRLIVMPQALRLIIPPTTNQYLDLAKSSSLAIAIGYPDLVTVINGVITDTGQAIECVALIMAAFLAINLSISALMNLYNAKMRLAQR